MVRQTEDYGVGAPPPEQETTKSAIGIPKGYTPPTRAPARHPFQWNTPPEYGPPGTRTVAGNPISDTVWTSGDEWGPLSSSPDNILRLQSQLVMIGFLNKDDVRPKQWDAKSAAAYKSVLAYANHTGESPENAMTQLLNNPTLKQLKGPTQQRQVAPVQTQNPTDIRAAVSTPTGQNVAQSMTGTNLSDSDSANFVQWYQDQEKQARDAYHSADLANQGGTYAGPPNIDNAAMEYIKEKKLNDVVSYGTASRMLNFFQMLGGSQGGT